MALEPKLRQDQAEAVAGQRHAAGRITGRVQQMDSAALVDRGGGDQNAVLDNGMAGERDVALLGQDQAGIADRAAAAAGGQAPATTSLPLVLEY